ncbi:putative metalloprotease [Rhodococcus sp. OK611]|jgi:predicted metalloprotease|uniref:metallopeptidase n=1 Tax=unclassified Rhodococcus (in: high G+C Gram-positive bacteria) TaxID=192944 RepID=UPI000BC95021|nr:MULTISPECIES: metallopeptidase [unclassified Rhodococcus (in: high G+C Gram-positive bacteria)]PTR43640.1 putative metalloprotease [Rhodococcus sp. OK611]SNX90985.1 Predicted metalloprotease [Rhodococcus sp. OK270]
MRRHRSVLAVASLVTLAALVAGCSGAIDGRAVSIYDNPFTVAGLPATSGPSGPREGVPDAQLPVRGADGSAADVLATNAVDDIAAFWQSEYPRVFGGDFRPVTDLLSWDPDADRAQAPTFCGDNTHGFANAGYCTRDGSIGWDRTVLLPSLIETFGPMSVVMVMAHEYGHAVQYGSGLAGDDDLTLVLEQQADCFAGAYMRHVAQGDSRHFTLNTSDGLNSVMAAMVAVRDSDPNDPESVHGSAFERITAFQIGFTDGAKSCTKIDETDVLSRQAELPQQFTTESDTGEMPVTEESVQLTVDSLQALFDLPQKPAVDFAGADTGCPDAETTQPVSYCPATNTIGVSMPELVERGTPNPESGDEFDADVRGDFGAYVLVASRFTLAAQAHAEKSLTEAKTAVRAACLSGAWTAATAVGEAGGLTLSPGDLDEAVSGLLNDGLMASDVNGNTVPSGFARVDAFRSGVLGGEQACENRYG